MSKPTSEKLIIHQSVFINKFHGQLFDLASNLNRSPHFDEPVFCECIIFTNITFQIIICKWISFSIIFDCLLFLTIRIIGHWIVAQIVIRALQLHVREILFELLFKKSKKKYSFNYFQHKFIWFHSWKISVRFSSVILAETFVSFVILLTCPLNYT